MICRLRAWLLHELPPSSCNVYTMRVPLRFGVQCLLLASAERACKIKPFHSLATQVVVLLVFTRAEGIDHP